MNKKHYLQFLFASLFLLAACDPLMDDFFVHLFDLAEVDVSRDCANNPPLLSDGDFIETYDLSEETLLAFEKKFAHKDAIHVPQRDYKPIVKYQNIMQWRRTNRFANDNAFVLQAIDPIEDNLVCFSITDLKVLLAKEGNYFTFFYSASPNNTVYSFQLFVLDAANRKLYMLQDF